MKKSLLMLLASSVFTLTACGNTADTGTETSNNNGESAYGLDENMRFTEPRTISVALWDRSNERIPNFDESYWADWVAAEILEQHNIVIDWSPVPRWEEGEFQSTQLAAQTAPDIGYTFNNAMVTTMANMGGIHNMYPLLEQYGHLLPNLNTLLGDTFLYWNLDPNTNELWSLTGRRAQDGGTVTFIREDWLNELGLPIPTTTEEFEATLIAFRDNADQLVENPNEMIPYFLTNDVAWDAMGLFDSFIPNDVTEREWFVYGFDDRRFHFEDAMREGARTLNHWFNEDLLWNDFVIAEPTIGHDQIRLGNVGSFHGNWDLPFRAGDAWITGMRENVGDQANFIPINPFTNDAGVARMFMSNPTDRFIFFPITNDEPLASLLYLDFMSSPEVLDRLQFGIEGVHHEVLENGAFAMLEENDDHVWPNEQVIPSLRNFDMTPTINGIHFDQTDPTRAAYTLGLGFPGIDSDAVLAALNTGIDNSQIFRNVITPIRHSEEGMSEPLRDQRDVLLHRVIAATSPEDFDATFDSMYQNYLNLGAAAIIAEREEAWIATFGDVDSMPQ